ncbi:glutaredoxin domain-containing protein [Acidovorax soli]|uniref:Glutaredoxin n=1 Tax=Acidovorax soli TaxID=592050 RepID=A0A1H4C3Z9_9BURK|nr:glutaredoxin domain-containing protein [Acidovorax soli]SEA55175.1 Glutaredoxin [Acidovorax soli]
MGKPLRTSLLASLGMVLAVAGAHAQTVYRIVGPDGKVTFSDRAPDSNAKPAQGAWQGSAAAVGSALPYELQQIAARFPVTLYTGSDCAPCNSARNLLVGRGIPFAERTVNTNEDIEALQRMGGNNGLPFATIGGQQLAGFSENEWTQYLNAAGYPQQSLLPPNYRRPPATPLVAAKAAQPAASDAPAGRTPAERPRPAPRIDGPSPSNPAGIRF